MFHLVRLINLLGQLLTIYCVGPGILLHEVAIYLPVFFNS